MLHSLKSVAGQVPETPTAAETVTDDEWEIAGWQEADIEEWGAAFRGWKTRVRTWTGRVRTWTGRGSSLRLALMRASRPEGR
jgi:hypothetical protein